MEPATKQDISQLTSDIAEMLKDQTGKLLEEIESFRAQNSREHEAMKRIVDDHELRIQTLEQKSVA